MKKEQGPNGTVIEVPVTTETVMKEMPGPNGTVV